MIHLIQIGKIDFYVPIGKLFKMNAFIHFGPVINNCVPIPNEKILLCSTSENILAMP